VPANQRVIKLLVRQDARDAQRLDALCDHIARNRFMPVPPSENIFVGDGDFRAIGAEFLRHFVKLGDLRPADRVLEIGCGIGRMALPLTQYLSDGTYDGMDVVADGITWCGQNITPVYPAFRFHHMDVANDLYNPAGRIESTAVTLPFADQSFDFVLLTSVLTHLQAAETLAYAWDISRLLRPGGRCFLSLFLMNDSAREGLRAGDRRLDFKPDEDGPTWLANPEIPSAAVAHDEKFLIDMFASVGLKPAKPTVYGTWCGRPNAVSYQDLLVLEKAPLP
jgi:SAM-dependent methyltransferase